MGIPFIQMLFIGLLPSPLKVAYYRMRGAAIGQRVRIGLLTVLLVDEIEIGDDCRIGMVSFIRARKLRLGNRVRIGTLVAIDTGEVAMGHDAVVMEQNVIGGMLTPRSSLFVGSRVKIFPYCFINPTEPIVIEDDVGVGGATYLFTHGSWQSVLDGFPIGFGPIHIRRGVWLPWRVFVLPNVDIGEFVTLGAGAVVNKSIPARSLAAGMPAKVISEDGKHLRLLTDEQRWEKVVEIMRALGEFLTYQHHACTASESAEVCALDFSQRGRSAFGRIVATRRCDGPDLKGAVIISLGTISEAQRGILAKQGSAWFDIGAAETNFGLAPEVEHVRSFFSRYGVRFAVTTDPVFSPSAAVAAR